MNLGLLPSAGGGIGTLAATGQAGRLINLYFSSYAQVFDQLTYFSYLAEALSDYTQNDQILTKTLLIPGTGKLPYRFEAFLLPLRHRLHFQRCQIFRVFQATGAIPALIAKKFYGIPYVTTYGYDYAGLAKTEKRTFAHLYLRGLMRIVLPNADGVIVTTKALADQVNKYTQRDRIHIIPNGVDTELFRPSARPKPAKREPTILFVGRFEPQKNLITLLQAVAKVQESMTVHLKLVGHGSLAASLKRQAVELKINVTFSEVVPHENLPAIFQEADLFVLPSLLEGHPKLLIEAMSSGLPCLVSNCEGNRNMVEEGKTGLRVDPLDVSGMAQGIIWLLTNTSQAQAFGLAARHFVQENYDIFALLRQEVKLLQALASQTQLA